MKLNAILLLFIPLFFLSCSVDETVPVDTKEENIQNKELQTEDYYFARTQNGETSRLGQPVFARGETVIFVLENVGELKVGSNNKHHVEIRMHVENQIGELIAFDKNLLSQKGMKLFKHNILKTPNARYRSTINDEPGRYTFTLTLVDFVAKDSLVIASQFILE